MDRGTQVALATAASVAVTLGLLAVAPMPVQWLTGCDEIGCLFPLGVFAAALAVALGVAWGLFLRSWPELWAPAIAAATVVLLSPVILAAAYVGEPFAPNVEYLLGALGAGVVVASVAAASHGYRRRHGRRPKDAPNDS